MKRASCCLIVFLITISLSAQYGNRDGNRIGISGGVSQSALLNSNFNTKPGIGFAGGFSVRGNYYNNWSMIYGMQFFQNTVEIETTSATNFRQNTDFNLSGVQIRFLGSYNIIKNHIAIDFGPVLQINGKFTSSSKEENNTVVGTNLLAKQLEEVGNFNGNIYVGFSAGGKVVRALIFYQYGFTNIFNKLNDDAVLVGLNNNQRFKGSLGTISGQIIFNL